MAAATRARRVNYPTSDGKPMAETDWHRKEMIRLLFMLERWFAAEPLVYVSGDLLVYYEEGNPRKHVAPDVFVAFGVPKKDRLYFQTWVERRFPSVVIEVTSKTTRREDLNKKFILYRDVFKTKEYILFDPLGDYLKPRLQCYRLARGQYVPMAKLGDRFVSRALGLHMESGQGHLLLINPATGKPLLTPEEHAEQSEAEVERLRQLLGTRNGSR